MMLRLDRVWFAWHALTRHRGRAVLLVLAISLSVASVLVMTALGQGARNFVAAEFSGLGKDLLVMFPGRKETTGGMPPVSGNSLRDITLEDMDYLGQRLPNLRLVPLIMGFSEAKQGAHLRQTMLLGTSNQMQFTHQLSLLKGQWLPGDPTVDASVCLLGARVAQELFGEREIVGQWVRFDNRRFRVVGVFTSRSSNLGMDFNEAALIPVGAAQSLFNTQGLFRLMIQPLGGQAMPGLIRKLEQHMRERHQGVLDVTVMRRDAMLQTFNAILLTLTLAVAGIGAISLLVSGIMMMNLALVSTHQRTGEIGLLKALGANARAIRTLFLTEALILSTAGSLGGLLVGYFCVGVAAWLWPDFPIEVPWLATLMAPLAAMGTGVLFSWIPARQAASKDAVASLRSSQL